MQIGDVPKKGRRAGIWGQQGIYAKRIKRDKKHWQVVLGFCIGKMCKGLLIPVKAMRKGRGRLCGCIQKHTWSEG